MAVNVIKRTWLQDRMVRPETLNGMAFQAEAGAHRFEITGYDSNGNVMAFSGTVTAIFLRPDNTDVPLTGVISNGVAQVTLSQECYQVPGRFGLAIFVNSGNTKTVVYKCIGPVGMTSSGVEASSVVQSVSTLIDRIEAAVNSIPQDYSALSKSVSATCPEMRDGSTGNPWNTDSITTKYVIKIDKSCDELILEYIGSTQAQYYVFGYSVFNGVADGTESYAARTSAASFLDYPEKYVQTEPYVIIPVSQLGDYTHIAIVLWAKSDETTFIPLRIATEQNNLRVTFRHASYMGHEEINNRSVKVGVQNASKMASPLKLVHFSDLHRDVNALNRIRASAKYVCPNADNIICTGDMVANTYAEITSWWIPEIMTCIGNHDTASYDGTYDWTALTMAQRDEMYISPFKSYWGIVHTAGTSYYYKDYTAAHIRLIVMDAMLYSGTPGAEATAQTQWLANLLASAITDSLHVIIAIHAPHGGSVPVACGFTKLGQETMPVNVDCNTPDVVINTVATAIGNGLHFIGYICGHTHQDAIWDCTGDRSQLMYTVTCAAVDQTAQWIDSDQYRSEELDAFNVLTIDTASTTIKILRGGGANTDVALRPRVSMVINYSTGKIITDTYASGTQDAVVYGDAQDLTDAQKAQARANIGAGSAADVSENTADITANANEITSLKSAFNNFTIEERKTNGIRNITDFVHGGPTNGHLFPLKLSDVTSRVRTKGFLYVNHGDTVVINPGSYKFAVWQWSGTPDSGSVVINRLWSTSPLTLQIPTTTDFIMVVYANKTDATAEIDLTEFDGTITITPYEQTQITNLEKTLNATRLNTNTDLNSITTPGYYTLMNNYTYTNLPEGAVGSAGVLFETKDSSINWQILFAVNNGKIFSRYKGSGNWNAWVEYVPETQPTKSISILFVGNSLTQDGIAYLPYLLKTYYPEISFKLYMWYNGGYTLAQQYTAFQNNTPCQIFSVAENNAAWTNFSNNKTMASVLSTYKFDIVSIQEYFNYKESYIESDLADWNNCKDYITANYTGGNGLEFITLFHAPLRSKATEVFNLTKNGINLTLQKTICDDMIPNGIAVYRALSTDLDNLGDQGHLSPDGTHTQEGLPCLLQTYVTACWLFDRLGLARSVYGCPMRMTTAIYNTLNVPGANLGTGVITGTDTQNLLAQEVAVKAYKEGKYYVENNIFSP